MVPVRAPGELKVTGCSSDLSERGKTSIEVPTNDKTRKVSAKSQQPLSAAVN